MAELARELLATGRGLSRLQQGAFVIAFLLIGETVVALSLGHWTWGLAGADLLELLLLMLLVTAHYKRRTRDALVGLRVMQAISRDQLFVEYQPKVDLDTGATVGVEALLRWAHPRKGLVAPLSFIEATEGTMFARSLDSFVLGTAVAQAKQWELAGTPVPVAVNLSARTLDDRTLGPTIEQLLQSYSLPPALLELEITERALEQTAHAADCVRAIADLGVGLAVDDFGVGYSALQRLVRLPIDTLKIDRSFIAEMLDNRRAAIAVYSAVELAHALELDVVAEGIETEDTVHALRKLRVDCGQGYLFAKPLSAEALGRWLQSAQPRFGDRRSGDERRREPSARSALLERRSAIERRANSHLPA
jgi:EAL domain-containing protein (putative c-di-GMP-specific phosphodiesterase class I)